MSLPLAREQAARGAQALSKLDLEWYECIDLGCLNLGSTKRCVLGQWAEANIQPEPGFRVPDFTDGLDAIGSASSAAELGFDIGRGTSYHELEVAWEEIILYLQAEADGDI